jgi:hypothetical protein
MQTIDTPNLVIPLASSYNERGVAGYTHTVTNSEDQRKINCFYEPVKNAATGKGTLTLSKRPGVTDSSGGSGWGTSTQLVYLIITEPNSFTIGKQQSNIPPWVISGDGLLGKVVASNATTDTTIVNTTYTPYFIDRTAISTTDTVVLQLRRSALPFGAVQRVFFASVIGTWTEITDADFTAIVHRGKMEHMDASNKIWNSDSNSLANWTNTSFLSKLITEDNPVGLARWSNQILAFGDDSVEMFYNAGNTTGSPLLPIKTLHQKIGLVGPMSTSNDFGAYGHYYCTIENGLYFVGRSAGGINSAGAYVYNGQNFEKISSPYIDKILSQVTQSSFFSVNTVGFQGRKAMSILLTDPNAGAQRWLMFFPDWKEWFEWTSTVFNPINSGEHFLSSGTTTRDKIYNFPSTDNWQDAGTSYACSTQFRVPTNGSQRKFMLMYGVDADTDTAGLGNTLTVELSIDDSQTFTTLGTIDLTQDRKILARGGSFRKGHLRLGNTNSRPTRLHNFLARIE